MRLTRKGPDSGGGSKADAQARASLGPAQEAPRVPFLDGIRGLAILLVILHHGNQVQLRSQFDIWLMNFTQTSWVGVDLFFVLSGFLITGILLDTRNSGRYFRSFYARRAVRIFPLYYLSIFVFFYIYFPIFEPGNSDIQTLKDREIWYWTYLSNIYTAYHGAWPRANHLVHLWSVSIEEQFYMVWPAVVLLLNRQRLKFACLCLIGASFLLRVVLMLSHAGPIPTYASTATRLDGLVLGALIAAMVREPSEIDRLVRNMRIAGAMGLAAIIGFFIAYGGMNMTAVFDHKGELTLHQFLIITVGILAVSLTFGWFLVAGLVAAPRSLLVRILSNRVLRIFGKYSYCIYLWHLPIHLYLTQGLRLYPYRFPTLFGSQIIGQTILYAALIGLSLLAAILSWNLFEKQFLKLKRYFPYGTVVEPGRTIEGEAAATLERRNVAMAPAGKP